MGSIGGAGGNGGGGAIGGLGLDLSMNNMPFVGGFFQDPNKTFLQQQFQQVAQANQAYRPELAQAHMNALANQLSAFQGANNVIAKMYGGQNAVDPTQLLKNPMSPNMMQVGAPGQGAPGQTNTGQGGGILGGLLGGGGGMLGGIL